ncbi:MAG: nucleotide exchange factor GrpE [Sandaracinaceae bacterium]
MSDVDSPDSPETRSDAPPPNDGEANAEATSGESVDLTPLAKLEVERDKLKDQLLRTAADFDNFRKRSRKELELAERKGKESVLLEVLPVIDNLERAVQAAQGATEVSAVIDGVNMVLKLFADTAQRLGLTRVESLGERFDPNLHDAFQYQETDAHPPGTIAMQYQAGYRLGDKLLRPAMVAVAKKPAGSEEPPT